MKAKNSALVERRGDGNKPFLPNLNLSKLYISVDAELKTESFRSNLTSPEFVHSHANLEILSFFFIIQILAVFR
jgi:hypothetical protein